MKIKTIYQADRELLCTESIRRVVYGEATGRERSALSVFAGSLKRESRRASALGPHHYAQGISKHFGASPLFQNVSFTVSEATALG